MLGPDPVQHAVRFAHDNRMEFFFSLRMNDIHCAVYPGLQYWSPFKLENPQLLQSRIDPGRFQSLSEIGDPDALADLDKMYQIDLDRKRVGYMNETLWPGQLPLSFTTQSGSAQHDLSMKIADRPEKASRITVQTRWDLASESDRISWRLNGQKQPHPRAATGDRAGWLEWETHDLQKGENTFRVTVQPPESGDASKPVSLEELRVWVRYG